ncbi:MAG: hypothetical protein ISS66_20120 [Desulfobacteraceae bacterium]|nr:hypothetical protein [Desulfobacteraceae bacterium]
MPEKKHSKEDETLETLLDLDGEIFLMENGYWTKFEVNRVEPTRHIPHGVRYSITLHDRNNIRTLGFDNAHAFKPKKKKYGARKITWDHKHKRDKISPYEYESASQLLKEFWAAVEEIIKLR